VPFMFVYEPALLMIGDWSNIIWASFTAAVGVVVFAAGLHGYFVAHSVHWQSAALVVAGLLLIDPHVMTSVIGAAMTAVVIVTQVSARRTPKAEIAVE
jgi:TRAP-type uncharacterized transport system fused permease subunit